MLEFDTYLFDFDGTLVDSHDSLVLVFKGAYSKVGIEVPESFVLRLMRIPLFQGYEELNAPDDKESRKIFGDEIIRLLDAPEVLKVTKTYEEVKDVLTELYKRGKKLGIVTSNNAKHVAEVLDFIGLDKNMFSVIVGNKETERHKPYPDPILKGLEILGETVDNACYVGDGLDDMRSAVNAMVTPVLVDRRDEYTEEHSDLIIKDLRGLLDY